MVIIINNNKEVQIVDLNIILNLQSDLQSDLWFKAFMQWSQQTTL